METEGREGGGKGADRAGPVGHHKCFGFTLSGWDSLEGLSRGGMGSEFDFDRILLAIIG